MHNRTDCASRPPIGHFCMADYARHAAEPPRRGSGTPYEVSGLGTPAAPADDTRGGNADTNGTNHRRVSLAPTLGAPPELRLCTRS